MREYCFGVDVGGTTVKIGLIKTTGEIVEKWEIETDTSNNGENILGDICKSLDAKLEQWNLKPNDIEGIGIGLPGPVLANGTVLNCVNLGWGTFNVTEKMSQLFHDVPVKADNDANVAALGEDWMGAGKKYSSIVMVTLGTGVGGGVIINKKIVQGFNGGAGEIGHITVNEEETESCNCGRFGCLEQYCSATGVVRLANRYLQTHGEPTKMRDINPLACRDVFNLAKEGDEAAANVVREMSECLGKGLSVIASVVNPQCFVIGGGVSKAGQYLIDNVERYYRASCFAPCSNAEVKLAELGNDAGIIGAAALVSRSEEKVILD